MPIRFRCVYCDQLLGIAKRKSGTVVKCPNCAGQVIVPNPENGDDGSDPDSPTARAEVPAKTASYEEKTAQAPAGGEGMLFERADFDELLRPALERNEPAIAAAPGRPSRKAQAPAPASWAPAPQATNAFDFAGPVPLPAPPPVPAPAPAYAPPVAATPKSGIVLTPIKLLFLSFFVIAGMGFAFSGGFLLAWLLKKS